MRSCPVGELSGFRPPAEAKAPDKALCSLRLAWPVAARSAGPSLARGVPVEGRMLQREVGQIVAGATCAARNRPGTR